MSAIYLGALLAALADLAGGMVTALSFQATIAA